jgi:outer membrane protein assembly factor BamB
MRRSARIVWHGLLGAIATAAVAGALTGCGESAEEAPHTPVPADQAWGAPNADQANTRKVTGPIDAASVTRLMPAWEIPVDGSYTATPVIADDVAFTQDSMSTVYAIDLGSGRLRWTARFESPNQGPNGVTVADGRVYGATNKGAFALDEETGRRLWMRRLARTPTEGIGMAPGHRDGTVYVSTIPAAGGDLGILWALDGASGRPLWKWVPVPTDLWGDPTVNAGGGMWHTPALDDDGGLYATIADPSPWPGTEEEPWGRSRPGDNRWSNSLVKLDARTGRFAWGYQAVPHDFYDWDLQCPPILATVDGRDIVLAAGKMGFVFAFDRETGELLWKRSVGIHNGHDNDSRRAMRGDYSNIGYGKKIYPGDWGGVQTQMASDGRTVYVPVNNLYSIFRSQTVPDKQDPETGTGEIVAIDIATGRVRWDRRLPHSVYGGASISNDVLFTNTFDGTVWALDVETGDTLWSARLPAGSIAPVTIAGDTILAGAGTPFEGRKQLAIVAYRLGAR